MPSPEQRRSLAEQAAKFHEQLKGSGAETYLADRGLNRRAAQRFLLGFDGERLTIPYLTPEGPWQIKRRCIADHDCKAEGHGKYKNEDGVRLSLYNAQTLLKADRVVIVEGELDAVAVESAGAPTVGYPGAQAWRSNKHWRWAFDSCDEVIVVADGDEPREGKQIGVGEEAGRSVTDSLRSSLPDLEVRLVVLPVGEDSNSFINKHGQLEYLEQIGWI